MHPFPVRVSFFPVLLICVGAALLLQRLHVAWAGWPALLCGLVAAGGAFKLYNGIVMKSRGRAFWGVFWLMLGGACLLRALDVFFPGPGTVIGGLFLAAGCGLLLVYAVAPRDWYVLVPSVCFLLLGGAILSTELGYLPEWEVAPLVNAWWPIGLILFGGALLLHAHRRGESAGLSAPPASSPPSPRQP